MGGDGGVVSGIILPLHRLIQFLKSDLGKWKNSTSIFSRPQNPHMRANQPLSRLSEPSPDEAGPFSCQESH